MAVKKPTRVKKPKNTGIPYEQLTREVFARMEDLQKVHATVKHNVTLTGKSGATHQVDVYVEFKAGGATYKTLVSCKDLRTPVKKGHVLELHGVLNDIPGQPRGVIVSRGGFQKGAQEYASHHGIVLYHLREKQETDWEGLFKEFHLTLVFEMPSFSFAAIELDNEWAKAEIQKLGINSGTWQVLAGGENVCVWESGKTTTWNDVFKLHMPTEPNIVKEVTLTFDDDRPMMRIGGAPLPRIPCNGFTAKLSYSVHEELIVSNFDDLVSYVFRDVLNGQTRFLAEDGGPPGAQGQVIPPTPTSHPSFRGRQS